MHAWNSFEVGNPPRGQLIVVKQRTEFYVGRFQYGDGRLLITEKGPMALHKDDKWITIPPVE